MNGALARYLIGQFGQPRGAAGWLAGWIMALRPSNRRRNRWTVSLMDLAPGDRVLEVGHGPGLALAHALARLPAGRVVGLDHSPVMSAMARTRNRAAVESGRLKLVLGAAEDLERTTDPALAGPFTHVYGVNVAPFWVDPAAVLRALRGRLGAGGRIYLTHQPRAGPRDRAAAAETLARQMKAAGFAAVCIETNENLSPPAACAIGTAQASAQSGWTSR